VSVVTTPSAIEFYSEKGRLEAAFLRAAGMDIPMANLSGSGGLLWTGEILLLNGTTGIQGPTG
jgi:hypothetical protein